MNTIQFDLFADAGDQPVRLAPPLKWAGGKTWQVPYVEPLWRGHRHRRYVEPFCGGLGMALGLRPEAVWVNDINEHVINFFRWCTRGLDPSIIPMAYDEALYYQHRSSFNRLVHEGRGETAEVAALFYYLNRTTYNGLCRFNLRGEFNAPFGEYKTINYRTEFSEYAAVFSTWQFTCHDFEQVPLDPDDFVYADPPYDVEFVEYSEHGFRWRDQVRVAEWLARHPGPVVLSNQATGRIVDLYQDVGFKLQYLSGRRRISCKGDRTPAKEVLVTRNLEP
jgi:DNA adenine methylase